MSLFTFSSKSAKTALAPLAFLCAFVSVNLVVAICPKGTVWQQFQADIQRVEQSGESTNVIIFGDSRSAVLDEKYFRESTLNLSAVSNTIAYSWLILNRIYNKTRVRPRTILLMLGPNNYNNNGIFTKRDYALSQVATLRETLELFEMDGGVEYGVDGLFGRLFPVYGRRMEFRSPRAVMGKIRQLWEQIGAQENESSTERADEARSHRTEWEESFEDNFPSITRRPEFDINYYLTYRRSVYVHYELSRLHIQMLWDVIDMAQAHGARVLLVQLPIEQQLLALQQKMVGDVFEEMLAQIEHTSEANVVDLRAETRFEFVDINHLSARGAYNLTKKILNPLIKKGEMESSD